MSTRILFVGGGTAGHSIPCLTVSEALADRCADAEPLFIGANRPGDRRLFERAQMPHVLIDAEPFPYRPSPALVKALLALRRVRSRVREIMAEFRPHAVFSTGGYVSGPVVPEARCAGVPVVLHAADALPGRANTTLARYADVITVAYEEAAGRFGGRETVWAGQPVRASIHGASRECGRAELGVSTDAQVIVAFGGSQGSDRINQAILAALPQLLTVSGLHIIHFTGIAHEDRCNAVAAGIPGAADSAYQCHGFVDEPGHALAAADIVISRCGSNSLAEITAVGAPCIAVPYPHAGGHQRLNAAPLVEAGAAVLIEDQHLSGGTLGGVVVQLLGDPERLASMSEASRKLSRPEAAGTIADLIREQIDRG